MARNFSGTTGIITITDATPIQNIFTNLGQCGIWFHPASSGESGIARIFDKENWLVYFGNDSGGLYEVVFIRRHSSANGIWKTGFIVPLNEWSLIVISYNSNSTSNDPTFYIWNNTYGFQTLTVGSGLTETTTPSGSVLSDATHNLYIGNRAADDRTFDGHLAHAFLISTSNGQTLLSAANIQALARGVNPFLFSPTFYMPLHGNDSPEPEYIQKYTGTLTATSKPNANPPVELLEAIYD